MMTPQEREQRWVEARKIAKPVIQHFENLRLKSYVIPKETWATVGWGVAIPMSQHPRTITRAEADRMFDEAFARKEKQLRKEIPEAVLDKLTINQLAALLSFRYNMMDSNWLSPLCNTRKSLIAGNWRQFLLLHAKWINGNAGPMPGLKRRRKVERDLLDNKSLESIKAANWYMNQKF